MSTVRKNCLPFPALDAKIAGFKVYAVIDASGDPSDLASRTTLARFTRAGVIPTSTNAVLSEVHRTWNRPEAAELAKVYALVAPSYAAVIESFNKGAGGRETTGPRAVAALVENARQAHMGLADRGNAALPRSQYQTVLSGGRAIAVTAIRTTEMDPGHEHPHDQGWR